LDAKNETSWTSWAMTSLSTKLSDYKSKNKQQASVALSSTGESKKAIENSSTNKQTENPSPPKEVPSAPKQAFTSPFETAFDSKPKDSEKATEGGWDQWQDDLIVDDDDDDKMEPLEPFTTNTGYSVNISTTKTTKSNDGWDTGNKGGVDDDNESVKSIKSTSNNWNVQGTGSATRDEEAIFSSLVKDVSLKIL
jgi:hypothetical protein